MSSMSCSIQSVLAKHGVIINSENKIIFFKNRPVFRTAIIVLNDNGTFSVKFDDRYYEGNINYDSLAELIAILNNPSSKLARKLSLFNEFNCDFFSAVLNWFPKQYPIPCAERIYTSTLNGVKMPNLLFGEYTIDGRIFYTIRFTGPNDKFFKKFVCVRDFENYIRNNSEFTNHLQANGYVPIE